MWRFFVFILLFSCSSNSRDEYKSEARSALRMLNKELKKVHSLDDLCLASKVLQKRYNRVVDLMILLQHQESEILEDSEFVNYNLSDPLKKEFKRIFQIHGCQKKMQEIQRDALIKLDKHHQRIKKGH